MKTIKGDLIALANDGHFDVVIHGCNCFCTMGAGIAKGVKAKWPEAYEADLATIKGDKDKLGSISIATVKTTGNGDLIVINAYTQFNYRGKGPKADYKAIRSCFMTVKEKYGHLRIGYPMIGAGLAGGDWNIISKIIEEELEDCDHTLVKYAPN